MEKKFDVTVQKVPQLGRRLRVHIESQNEFTDIEKRRHKSAGVLLEMVINSAQFKEAVLIKTYTTTKLTPRQIYDKIMTGEEALRPGVDYELDVSATIYEKNNNTVGYTTFSGIQTWVNRKFFKQYEIGQIACNMFHEWLHQLFGKTASHSSAKDFSSVPYSLGYLVAEMIGRWEKGERFVDLYPEPGLAPKKRKHCIRTKMGLLKSCWYE